MRKEQLLLMGAVFMGALIISACAFNMKPHGEPIQVTEVTEMTEVDLIEFEIVRVSLYDCAMGICTSLAECDGGCFYDDVDKEYVEMFKTYRVPSLEVLLTILDQIEDKSCLWDVYDDEETMSDYYMYREKYESYF